jgi:hypothetical protein
LVYGEPLFLPPEYPSLEETNHRRRALAQCLHDLEAQASAVVGRTLQGPPHHCLTWLRRQST